MLVSIMTGFLLPIFAGWISGVVINYLSDTLPIARRLSKPFCHACGTEIGIVNYFIWPRRCNHCGSLRPCRVWLVEFFMVLSSVWLWSNSPANPGYWVGIVVLAYFILITIIDLEHRLILHITSLVGVLFGLWVGIKLHGFPLTVAGGATGFFLMLALYYSGFVYLRISRKLRGKESEETEALGFGDVNLSGIIGLFLGWPGILLGLILAILIAGLVSLFYLLSMLARHNYHPDRALPYGPFLAISTVILLFLRNILF
jgi:leader peptidase (prepilin peptidase) / N-methyltransferase